MTSDQFAEIRARWAKQCPTCHDDVAALLAEVEKMRPAYEAVERLRVADAALRAADDACAVVVAEFRGLQTVNPEAHAEYVAKGRILSDALEDAKIQRETARRVLLALPLTPGGGRGE